MAVLSREYNQRILMKRRIVVQNNSRKNTKWRYEGGRFKPLFLFEITPSRLIIQDGDKKTKNNNKKTTTTKQTKKKPGVFSNEEGTSYNVQSHITDIFPLASWFLLHKLSQSSVCFQG